MVNYLLGREIKMEHPRNINYLSYWNSSVDVMHDHYHNKTIEQLETERAKDSVFFNYIKKLNPENVLEIGCGFGYTLKKVANNFNSIECFGCDFSSNLISSAKDYCKGFVAENNIKIADATRLKTFYDKKFDLIFTSGCLMCLNSSQVKAFLNQAICLSDNLVLMEPDYSDMSFLESLRFKKDRNYPINDYKKIFAEIGNLDLIKEYLVSGTTVFRLKVKKESE